MSELMNGNLSHYVAAPRAFELTVIEGESPYPSSRTHKPNGRACGGTRRYSISTFSGVAYLMDSGVYLACGGTKTCKMKKYIKTRGTATS